MDSPPLLNKNKLIELGMIKIDPDGTFKETNELRIKSVKPLHAIEVLLSEYNDNFQGIPSDMLFPLWFFLFFFFFFFFPDGISTS